MNINRRQLLASVTAGLAIGAARCGGATQTDAGTSRRRFPTSGAASP